MSAISTLHELYRFNTWANEKVLGLAEQRSEEELDQPFEMGMGTLRKTIAHIWSAEWLWLERWKQASTTAIPLPVAPTEIAQAREWSARTASERAAYLDGAGEARLADRLTYRNTRGETHTKAYRDMMLHVANHGVHHRAQAVNMLRHLGARPPRVDYIFMKIEAPDGPAVAWSLDLLRRYFELCDAAQAVVSTAAELLPDSALDHPFEMGLGALRDTLIHIGDAEQWWMDNWQHGPRRLFPSRESRPVASEIHQSFVSHARQRDAYFSAMTDADLLRTVRGQPVKDVFREFPIAITMLQLCTHGTHHRAQAINMVRRLGGVVPTTDLVALA